MRPLRSVKIQRSWVFPLGLAGSRSAWWFDRARDPDTRTRGASAGRAVTDSGEVRMDDVEARPMRAKGVVRLMATAPGRLEPALAHAQGIGRRPAPTVVPPELSPELAASYAACRRLQRRHDPTYYLATLRLPREVRPAVHALYGFVRTADEIVDGPSRPPDPAQRRRALDSLERDLERTLAGAPARRRVVAALVDAGRRHELPLDELAIYLDSMRVDCRAVRIATWGELERYMRGSAAAVGHLMAPLLGAPAEHRASFGRLGVAFQLTNFIRDVREDWRLGRVYLPEEDRARFGVAEQDLARPRATPELRAVIALQTARARRLFREGAAATSAVAPSIRPGMRLARAVYEGVLDRVERNGFDVLGRRSGASAWQLGRATLGELRARG
jgi:15-cis-phytoene synthase